jgi:hypothetical protein
MMDSFPVPTTNFVRHLLEENCTNKEAAAFVRNTHKLADHIKIF